MSGLRARIESGGGMTFMGTMGVGKTIIVGAMNAKPPKDVKLLNLFIACQTAYAEKQAEEVCVARGDKPLTQGRMSMLEKRLSYAGTDAVTVTLTPASAGNLLSPKHKFQEKLIEMVKAKNVTCINIEADEVHKWYQGRSNKPSHVAAFREELRKKDTTLVVTGITATPLWDVKGKDQDRLAKRACTLFGHKADKPVETLEENTIEVSSEDAKGIFAEIKPLQTPAPETFEVREVDVLAAERSQELA
eukprot:5679408-Prymnesium_polylepis.1